MCLALVELDCKRLDVVLGAIPTERWMMSRHYLIINFQRNHNSRMDGLTSHSTAPGTSSNGPANNVRACVCVCVFSQWHVLTYKRHSGAQTCYF